MCKNALVAIFGFVLLLVLLFPDQTCSQPWSDVTIRSLPDSSFSLVEMDKKGNKVRHFPYRDVDGRIDIDQLIFCIGTFSSEEWVVLENKAIARKHLDEHYYRFKLRQCKEEIPGPININSANLKELVRLPNIGPVSAVKICDYRQTRGPFQSIEDIKNVEGIGSSTFAGIRYYIKVKD